jgi:diguanylate cyclase (GGDEF)-like protein
LFYAAAPLITRDGYRVGSFCLIDTRPHKDLSTEHTALLQEFAHVVIETMELGLNQRRTREALERATEVDPVTGLPNRTSLIRSLTHYHDVDRDDAAVGVLKVRLDRMERIHGSFGEESSNEVLRETSRRLGALVSEEEVLARGDGDTFMICWRYGESQPGQLFDSIAAWGDARSRQIQETIAQPYALAGEMVQLSASVGIAWSDSNTDDPYTALERAYTAAGTAQADGGNRVMWFTDTLSHSLRRKISTETHLREAVAAEAFQLVYQPIVDIEQAGKVVGAEALLRWPDQELPAASPGFFIPLAEEMGLMPRLGSWVFRRACRDQAEFERAGLPVWLSINLSPVQLTADGLADHFARMAAEEGVDPGNLKLEITESALAQDFGDVVRCLEAFKGYGFKISLDDFGTGFSSLARVARLPFDNLKIDRGFVSDFPQGPGRAVVSAIADLSANLGMTPIAEGVETAIQENGLREESISLAQGFLYSPGIAIDAFADYVRAHPGTDQGAGSTSQRRGFG